MRFPNRKSVTGLTINKYLSTPIDNILTDNMDAKSVHILFSENRWEAVPEMIELLNAGVTLIVDRYAYSGTAYSVAKGLDPTWCMHQDSGLPAPDLAIFMNIRTEDASRRSGFGQERYETSEFQDKVMQQYLALTHAGDEWRFFDASRSIASLADDIATAALPVALGAWNSILGALWHPENMDKYHPAHADVLTRSVHAEKEDVRARVLAGTAHGAAYTETRAAYAAEKRSGGVHLVDDEDDDDL
jgi:dTMP kinase